MYASFIKNVSNYMQMIIGPNIQSPPEGGVHAWPMAGVLLMPRCEQTDQLQGLIDMPLKWVALTTKKYWKASNLIYTHERGSPHIIMDSQGSSFFVQGSLISHRSSLQILFLQKKSFFFISRLPLCLLIFATMQFHSVCLFTPACPLSPSFIFH